MQAHDRLSVDGVSSKDSATLSTDPVVANDTGTPVYCPLPPTVVERLRAVRNDDEQFFFYDGASQRQSMVKSWDRVFQKVFATATPAITGGHPHRFRDTFAVSLLLKGVSIEIVSTLLGHRSIR